MAPAFNSVVKELKNNRKSDIIAEGLLLMLIIVLGGVVLALWLRTKSGPKTNEAPQA